MNVGDECFEVVFGLPWSFENFLAKATEMGHPANFCKRIPDDIQHAIDFQAANSFSMVSEYRLNWCKTWLKRAAQLDKSEKKDAAMRHPSTAKKRLNLTRELLESLQYEDIGVLDILEHGSPLAGEIEAASVFQPGYRPCVTTLGQLESDAYKRNKLVMSMTKSSGSEELDMAVLSETMEEITKGWADGPWPIESLEEGATVSRRFRLQQGDKVRMIDDYSISGVNDSCTLNSKLDLHVIDTFVATAKIYFQVMRSMDKDTTLLAKTFDLKSAYRQVPILPSHLKFAYFCIYNPQSKSVEVYRSRTLPFGATHSVFSFLRLARMLHCIATRGAKLITTNFYDDFILASSPLLDSARHSMELIFMLTGWDYATEGKKATDFGDICNALGVTFDLRESSDGILKVQNTQKRIDELIESITKVLKCERLDRHDTLKLRGRLGFADGFLHGRLGSLTLKRLIDHAYGSSSMLDESLANVLGWMMERLKTAKPKRVDAGTVREWCIFTDASYTSLTPGLQGWEACWWIPQVTALRGFPFSLTRINAICWEQIQKIQSSTSLNSWQLALQWMYGRTILQRRIQCTMVTMTACALLSSGALRKVLLQRASCRCTSASKWPSTAMFGLHEFQRKQILQICLRDPWTMNS